MNDFERFEELIKNGAGCISIVTYEEGYVLDIARSAAMGLGRRLSKRLYRHCMRHIQRSRM